jgi:hypothetical protein
MENSKDEQLTVGTRIRFPRELWSPATGDRPSVYYAAAGETGEIIEVGGCREGFWVKTDSWPSAFGASREEFVVLIVSETEKK